MAIVCKHVTIHGYVQGVGFRYFVIRSAAQFNLTGNVRNLHDGSVELIAEGVEKEVNEFLNLVKKGPPASRIDRVEVRDLKPTGQFDTFGVEY